MADRQRVYEGRPGLSEWGEDLGELNPRVLRAARAGVKANVMPESPSGVPFAGLVESTKSLPALPYFLGDLITGSRYGLSESAPQFAVEASSKYDELLNKYLAEEGLSESGQLPILEKYGLAAGEMLGQLPVPGKMLERMTKTLPKAFKPAGWLAEYFGPTVDPKAVNYAIGTGVGGTLRTATGEEPEKFAKGGLGRKPIIRATAEGVVEARPPQLSGTTIVKPTGNLNLAPAIRAEALKGPEKQTLESFRQQAAKLPGVTKGGYEEQVLLPSKLSGVSPQTVISKSEFEQFVPPSAYGKVDLKGGAVDAYEHYLDLAGDQLNSNYDDVARATLERLGLNSDDERNHRQLIDFMNGSMNVDQSFMGAMRRAGISNADQLANLETEVFGELAVRYARDMMENDASSFDAFDSTGYKYADFQRLVEDKRTPGYFEIGVTHPSVGQSYRHYPNSPEPMIGHIRGTYIAPELFNKQVVIPIQGGGRYEETVFDAKPNSVVIEELQADTQKEDFTQTGPLRQVHGTLFKAAVQEALERGADTVYLPTSIPIAAVRGMKPKEFTSIYDQQVVKEGLNPLKQIPGVSVTPIDYDDRTMYYQIDFTPEAKEYILRGPGQLAPGYADGGLARYAKGGLGRKPIIKRTAEGAIETAPAAATEIRKEPGGNWLPGSVERIVSDLQRTLPINEPVINWLETKLTNYIKNDMATERDPVRRGIEQRVAKADESYARGKERIAKNQKKIAEAKARGQDTTAVEDRLAQEMADLEQKYQLDKTAAGSVPQSAANYRVGARAERQFSNSPALASTPESAAWEDITDYAVDQGQAVHVRNRPFLPKEYAEELSRIPYDAKVYELRNSSGLNEAMTHIRDELYNSTRVGTDLPPELKLKPEDLQKMNMDAVVAHVGKVDAWRERNRMAANLLKSRNAATVTHKEYPGTGLEWKELKMPEPVFEEGHAFGPVSGYPDLVGIIDQRTGQSVVSGATEAEALGLYKREERTKLLQDALEYEGQVMGHCVGGYCPQVASGQKRIFSLRDAKGEPHVTIEVRPGDVGLALRHFPGEWHIALIQQAKGELFGDPQVPNSNLSTADQDKLDDLISRIYLEKYGPPPAHIVQIKGKGNLKPKDKYIPFVQDFVKSGKWGYISDFENTDLIRRGDKYYTKDEFDALAKETVRRISEGRGYAGGGIVESGNIDLGKLPVVRNPDGSVSTVSSIGIEMDGTHFVIPTIINGRRVTPDQAVDHFKKTHQHLGAFSTREAADIFAQRLHESEAERVGEYDERAIEEIVEPLRRKLEPFLGAARKVPRKLKQAAADITEIGPIIKRSNELPLKYFDISGEAGGEADAMRHLLFQAQLARKYGETPAKIISTVHEYTTLGQPESQREMDFYNDELGREIAAKAMSDEDLVRLAEKYVKSGRAKVLPKEQRGGY